MSTFNPTSLFKESNFRLQLKQNMPALEVMVNVTNIPGFGIGQMEFKRPGIIDKRPGEHLSFEDLIITVLCDEKLEAYKEIHNYLLITSNPQIASIDPFQGIFDSTLLLTTNKNNLQHKIRFFNCFFKNVGDISLTATTDTDNQVSFQVTLGYSYFSFE